MLYVTIQAPLVRLQPVSSGWLHSHECRAPLSQTARTLPRARGLDASRFPAQSTFRRVRSLRHLRGACYVVASEVFPRGRHAHTRFALSPQRSAFSTLRRFLPARHSLSSYPRGYTPEWRLGYFQPTSTTQYLSSQTAPVLTSLESDFGFAPGPLEVPVGSRRRARFGGTARTFDKLFACRLRGDLRL
jgi:hypothetical protein